MLIPCFRVAEVGRTPLQKPSRPSACTTRNLDEVDKDERVRLSECPAGSLSQGLLLLLQDILSDTLPKKPDDLALGAQCWAVGEKNPICCGHVSHLQAPSRRRRRTERRREDGG